MNIYEHIIKAREEALKRNIEANTIIIDKEVAVTNDIYFRDGDTLRHMKPMIFGMDIQYSKKLPNNANFVIGNVERHDSWLNEIGAFETCQCFVHVYTTPYSYRDELIYVIVSIHKKDGKELIRFGNRKQVQNIIDSYNLDYMGSKKPEINW